MVRVAMIYFLPYLALLIGYSLYAMEYDNAWHRYFMKSVRQNNIQQVREYVKKRNVNINELDNNGLPAIYTAIKRRNFGIALFLLKQPTIKVDYLPWDIESYETLLHALCSTKRTTFYENPHAWCQIARKLVKCGVQIDEQNFYSQSPLLLALEHCKPVEFIECLIDNGAMPERQALVDAVKKSDYLRAVLKSSQIQPYDIIFLLNYCKTIFQRLSKPLFSGADRIEQEKVLAHKKKIQKRGRILKRYYQTMQDLGYICKNPCRWKKSSHTKAAQLVAYYTAREQK